jgi:Ca2+-binding RTX toxin-like protein
LTPTGDFRIVGVSNGLPHYEQDLIVINPAVLGRFQVLHHRGQFTLNNGAVVEASPGSSTLVTSRLVSPVGVLRLVIEAGQNPDFAINNTAIPCLISGGGDDDYLVGGAGRDTINGGGGNDQIAGMGENDTLNGDGDGTPPQLAGDDVLNGGTGADTLRGGTGSDTLAAGNDHDIDHLSGGSGDNETDYYFQDWTHVVGNIYSTIDVIDDPIEVGVDVVYHP